MQAEAFSSLTQWSTIPVNAIKKLLVSLEISISHGGFNHLAKLTFGKNTFIVFFIWYLIPPREISGGVFEPSREYHFHKDPPFKLILISFIQINNFKISVLVMTTACLARQIFKIEDPSNRVLDDLLDMP